MSVINDLVALVVKLPAPAISALVSIVNAALASGSPNEYLKRLAQAKAAHAATQATAAELLKKTTHR